MAVELLYELRWLLGAYPSWRTRTVRCLHNETVQAFAEDSEGNWSPAKSKNPRHNDQVLTCFRWPSPSLHLLFTRAALA
jgi:hypothetical protein